MANGTVGTDAEFWKVIFDGSDTTIRVGKYRTAMLKYNAGNRWICLRDEANYPHSDAKFKTRQEAIDWMIEQQYVDLHELEIKYGIGWRDFFAI